MNYIRKESIFNKYKTNKQKLNQTYKEINQNKMSKPGRAGQ